MEIDQLKGRSRRLKFELAMERKSQTCRSGVIGRLIKDIARTDCEIAMLEPQQRESRAMLDAGVRLQQAA